MENQNNPLDWNWTHIMTNTNNGDQLYIRQDYYGRVNPTNSYTLVRDGVATLKVITRRPTTKDWVLTEEGEELKADNWNRG